MLTLFKKRAIGDTPVIKTFPALGTINTIHLFDSRRADALERAVERVMEIEDRMSAFKTDSDISKISRMAGTGFVEIHKDTFQLLRKAMEYSRLSDGAFDITVRPLVELWGINKKGDYVPSDGEIDKGISLVDFRNIELDAKTCSAALKKPGQQLDLGGIAKGYAADEVRRILLKNGARSAIINLGGNVVAVGRKPDGSPWQVGIQNPLSPTGQYIGVLTVSDKTIVTSGSNERFFIKDGVRYHHILDPRTGRPVQNSLLSVTAVCTCSADADALTTALFVLGPEKGLELLRKVKAEAIFIGDDLTVTVTPGLINQFHLK